MGYDEAIPSYTLAQLPSLSNEVRLVRVTDDNNRLYVSNGFPAYGWEPISTVPSQTIIAMSTVNNNSYPYQQVWLPAPPVIQTIVPNGNAVSGNWRTEVGNSETSWGMFYNAIPGTYSTQNQGLAQDTISNTTLLI